MHDFMSPYSGLVDEVFTLLPAVECGMYLQARFFLSYFANGYLNSRYGS